MGLDYAGLMLENTEKGIVLTHNTCLQAKKGVEEKVSENKVEVKDNQDVWLRVEVKKKGVEAVCQFLYSFDGKKYIDTIYGGGYKLDIQGDEND